MVDFFYTAFWILTVLFLLQLFVSMVLTVRMSLKMEEQPKKIMAVSIVIPFHNEFLRILPLLESLNAQRVERKMIELIFVDDHSTDSTADLIKSTLKIPYTLISLNQKS